MRIMTIAVIGLALILGATAMLSAAEKPTIESIIKKVRKNEKSAENYSMEIESAEFRVFAEAGKVDGKKAKPIKVTRTRVIVSGEQYFLLKDNSPVTSTIAASDGKSSRVVTTLGKSIAYASVYDKRRPNAELPRPNALLLERLRLPKPFSRLLSLKKDSGRRYEWRVLDEEKIIGLKAVKLELTAKSERSGAVFVRCLIWLAIERSYQPVRVESYFSGNRTKLPNSVARVTKFQEPKAGIWIPATTETEFYDRFLLNQGKQRLESREVQTVKNAQVDPKVKSSLFKDAMIPKGASVTEYQGDKAVRQYKQK